MSLACTHSPRLGPAAIGKKDEAPKTLFGSTRHILYMVTWCLIFCLGE